MNGEHIRVDINLRQWGNQASTLTIDLQARQGRFSAAIRRRDVYEKHACEGAVDM